MANRSPKNPSQGNNAIVTQPVQPTVRVMRLYKPGLHTQASFSPLEMALGDCSSVSTRDADCADFSISPYLLLPDSFGDIYLGENFSAYVAVVNGTDGIFFSNVSMQLHLLSTNSTIELEDMRASPKDTVETEGISLAANEYRDKVIMRSLSELNTHTLRVTVQFAIGRGSKEMKTMRKFYRFNVLQPLLMTTSLRKMGAKVAVQCSVTNSTQTPLFIEGTQFVPAITGVSGKSLDVDLPKDPMISEALLRPLQSFNMASVPILQPGERYGFAYIVGADDDGSDGCRQLLQSMANKLGHIEVTWCAHMGERGVLRGDDLKHSPLAPGAGANRAKEPPTINKLECVCCSHPSSDIHVGSRFPLSLSCINHTNKPIAFRLEINANKASSTGHVPGDSGVGLDLELPLSALSIGPFEMLEYSCQVTALRGGLQGLGEVRAVSMDDPNPPSTLWCGSDLVHVLVLP
jgi:hypothetical protein